LDFLLPHRLSVIVGQQGPIDRPELLRVSVFQLFPSRVEPFESEDVGVLLVHIFELAQRQLSRR